MKCPHRSCRRRRQLTCGIVNVDIKHKSKGHKSHPADIWDRFHYLNVLNDVVVLRACTVGPLRVTRTLTDTPLMFDFGGLRYGKLLRSYSLQIVERYWPIGAAKS